MANVDLVRPAVQFDCPKLRAQLDGSRDDPAQYDALDFGLVAMDLDGTVLVYNGVSGSTEQMRDSGRGLSAAQQFSQVPVLLIS